VLLAVAVLAQEVHGPLKAGHEYLFDLSWD